MLSNPEERARYDIVHTQQQKGRWKLVSTGTHAENDFEVEQMIRLTVLEVLYTKRRMEPREPAIYATDLEEMIGRAREQLEFTHLVSGSAEVCDPRRQLTPDHHADGVDHLEANYRATTRLRLSPDHKTPAAINPPSSPPKGSDVRSDPFDRTANCDPIIRSSARRTAPDTRASASCSPLDR